LVRLMTVGRGNGFVSTMKMLWNLLDIDLSTKTEPILCTVATPVRVKT